LFAAQWVLYPPLPVLRLLLLLLEALLVWVVSELLAE